MSDDAATKQNVIGHMNKDHHDSVVRYLENYHKQSAWSAYSGKISDIDLNRVTFTSDAGIFRTPFNPPMKSLREARERLVAMDKESVRSLGRSDVTLKGWTMPETPELVLLVGTLVIFIALFDPAFFAKGSILGTIFPEFARLFILKIRFWTLYGLLGVHVLEIIFIMAPKLRKFNVNLRSPTYWAWCAEGMIGGVITGTRMDKLVAQQKKEKAQQKH